MPQPHSPAATPPHTPHATGWRLTFGRTLGLSAPVSLVALWLALSPPTVRAAEEPVDVPITRGKIDLSGLKPTLALPSPAGASAPATPGTPASPAAAVAAPAAAAQPGAARPKPRTVADYVAEAKAKAAAEAAAKTTGTPPPPGPATAATPTPPPAAASAPATAVAPVPVAPAAAPAPSNPPPAQVATEKAVPPPKALPKPPAPVPTKAAPKPRDEGLDKVAIKLVEAMARAAAKQDKREAAQPKPKAALGSKEDIKARAAAVAGHTANGQDSAAGHGDSHGAHWAYEGPGGPENWAKLKPDFNTCAVGQRQSPIAIDNSATLQGPAEPIGFSYQASEGSVVHNGHTIQVDLAPGNAIAVRDSTYQLLQFHFHHPAEETVNGQGFAMVAHLVHKNAEGQLAVVAVLLTPGEANPAVDTVWKYMPVDRGDRVKLPAGALNLPDLLPKDQRYYQFMGSLTTPPCTEGVLWMVLKTPVTLSPAQIRLFGQLFPHNARPVQPVNGRPVREAL